MAAFDSVPVVHAPHTGRAVPLWATAQRSLFSALEASVFAFEARYLAHDAALVWGATLHGRDGADDFYESAYNWPLLYLLGGGDRLLPASVRQWEAVTRQVSALKPVGQVLHEYERGYDWFHQGESNLFFYFLCLADPDRPAHRARAARFASLYLGDSDLPGNYDRRLKIIRAAHNGTAGPRWGFTDDAEPTYGWGPAMRRYGLPFADIPGVRHYDDLDDVANARRMGDAMQTRMGRGDVVGNLAATGLAANAYAATGNTRYRDWVVDYTGAWLDRTRANGGLIPDNIGLSGGVGEYVGGRWYGGLYGWTWPHGFYSVAMSAVVAASSATLVTGDTGWMELGRAVVDRAFDLGAVRDYDESLMTLPEHWVAQRAGLAAAGAAQTFLIPHRHGDAGWFDWQPMAPMYPAAIWASTLDPTDMARIERLRDVERYDWRTVIPFRSKEDSGHETPWLRFLAGDNPTYPNSILAAAAEVVETRVAAIRADRSDLRSVNIHHWQQHNPVTTEALVQLTMGGPPPIYNGGLLHVPVRHFDARAKRPGLPPDVAALVRRVDEDGVCIDLVNVGTDIVREVAIQAGAYAEHRWTTVHTVDEDGTAIHGPVAVDGPHIRVTIDPGAVTTLILGHERYVSPPSTQLPWR
ncbi:MAG: hypothetical protein KGS10_03945 [Chloroflexi bacterium]|nr:hypothetical protein [Chloroflexota bacterium]